jgi:hypothetical protein
VHARVSPQIHALLRQHCAAHRVSSPAVIEAAIRDYVSGVSDPMLLMRRLDRLGRAQERLHRDLELMMETFAVFMKLWFAHTPAIAQDSKRGAQSAAESRYRQFVDYVGQQFAGGHRFVQDLPQEAIADATELSNAAAASGVAAPSRTAPAKHGA